VGLYSALVLIISNALDVLISLTHDVHASFFTKKTFAKFSLQCHSGPREIELLATIVH